MLKYFHPFKVDVFKRNPLAKILEIEAARLKNQGYQIAYAKQILNNIASFGDWLQENGISVKIVDKETATRFLEQYKPPRNPLPQTCLKGIRTAVYSVVKHIEELYPESRLKTPIEREIHAFRKHLLDVLNLAKGTRVRYENFLRIFLEYFFQGKRVNLTTLTPKMIRDYIDQVPSIILNAHENLGVNHFKRLKIRHFMV